MPLDSRPTPAVDKVAAAVDQFREQQEAYLARAAALSPGEAVDDYDRGRVGGSIQARVSFQLDRKSVIGELVALRNAAVNAIAALERRDLAEVEKRILSRNAFRAGCDTIVRIRKAAGEA